MFHNSAFSVANLLKTNLHCYLRAQLDKNVIFCICVRLLKMPLAFVFTEVSAIFKYLASTPSVVKDSAFPNIKICVKSY